MTKLTAAGIEKLKPTNGRRIFKDDAARSLYLIVYPSGVKSFAMRFRKPNGTPAKLTLGTYDANGKELKGAPVIGQPLTLAAARTLAATVLRERALGADVFGEHRAAKHRQRLELEHAGATAFGALAKEYVEEHARPRTRRWRETAMVLGLRYPLDGGEATVIKGGLAQRWATKPVHTFNSDDVHGAITEARRSGTPGRKRRNKGMSDARGRHMARALSRFFNWCRQNRYITASPCVGVHAPPPGAARERVLGDDEIRLLWQTCDKVGAPFSQAVKLLVLTGQRRTEVGGMLRSELGPDGLWSLPGSRTKNRKPHTVPLADMALKIIRSMPVVEECPCVFSSKGRTAISGWSKAKEALDREMMTLAKKEKVTVAPWTLHDLRRSCATGMAKLGVQLPVIEKVLNHSSESFGGVVAVYQRHSYDAEKREALQRWALHVQGFVSGKRGSNVVVLRKRARA